MSDPRSKFECEFCFDRKIWKDNVKNVIIDCPYCQKPKINKTNRNTAQSWHYIWMKLAKMISYRSTCRTPNRQVGCVIVSEDNSRVLALGYNGSAKGDTNHCEYGTGEAFNSRCTCVHAEMNALTKLDPTDPVKKKLYTTLSPCDVCYKLIVNAGIDEVIYLEEYNCKNVIELKHLGINVIQVKL